MLGPASGGNVAPQCAGLYILVRITPKRVLCPDMLSTYQGSVELERGGCCLLLVLVKLRGMFLMGCVACAQPNQYAMSSDRPVVRANTPDWL